MAKVIYRSEFERRARIIGQDEPDVRKIRFAMERNLGSSDSGLRLLDGLARLKNIDLSRTDAFYKHIEPEEVAGPIVIGTEKFHGYPVGLSEKELGESMFITARPGGYKTSLLETICTQWVELGNKVFIVSVKRDFAGLVEMLPDCCVSDLLDDFPFNPLQPPCPSAANRHAQTVANIFRKNFGQFLSGESSLYVAIDQLYEKFGIYAGQFDEFPTMFDVREYVQSQYLAPYTEAAEAKERLLKRLELICRSLRNTINASRGIPTEQIMEHNIVLLVDRVSPQVRDFIIECLLVSMFTYRIEYGERL